MFRISKEDIPAVAILKALSETSVKELISALDSSPLALEDPKKLAAQITARVPSIPVQNLEHVLDTLRTFYFVREFSGVHRSRFLDDLIEGIQNEEELAFPEKDAVRIRSRFEKLLNIDVLNIIAKARGLLREGERVYCTAKIISDIRPVFGAKPTVRPRATVVTHTLRIGYHKGGDHREFRVVLDSGDLENLKDLINRAEAKEKTLRTLLRDAKLPDLTE